MESKGAFYVFNDLASPEFPIFAITSRGLEYPQIVFKRDQKKPFIGILGIAKDDSTTKRYVMVVTESSFVAFLLPNSSLPIYRITKTVLVPIDSNAAYQDPFRQKVEAFYSNDALYYSTGFNITERLTRNPGFDINGKFVLNRFLLKRMKAMLRDDNLRSKMLLVIRGYVNIGRFFVPDPTSGHRLLTATVALITRVSPAMIATRYGRRGADSHGNVANHAETEVSLILTESGRGTGIVKLASFVQVRGSVPVMWGQTPDLTHIVPKIEFSGNNLSDHIDAFKRHVAVLQKRYGNVAFVNLLSDKPGEHELAELFHNISLIHSSSPMVRFDVHKLKNLKPLSVMLIGLVKRVGFDILDSLSLFDGQFNGKFVYKQHGVVRTNCLDCLDRTNHVQKITSEIAVSMIFDRMGIQRCPAVTEIISWINNQWTLNGNHLSLQSCGSRALHVEMRNKIKTQVKDVFSSATRFYQDHFNVADREMALRILHGAQTPTVSKSPIFFLTFHKYLDPQRAMRPVTVPKKWLVHWFDGVERASAFLVANPNGGLSILLIINGSKGMRQLLCCVR